MQAACAAKTFAIVGATLLAAAWTAERSAARAEPRGGRAARSGIPVGEWSGRGVCLYEWWDPRAPSPVEDAAKAVAREKLGDAIFGESYEDLPPDDAEGGEGAGSAEPASPPDESGTGGRPGRAVTIHRRYPTMLRIWEARLDHRDILMLDIRSRRGPLPGLGEETHMIIALQQTRHASAGTALYRVLGIAFNPEEGQLPTVNDMSPPCSATCTTQGDTTILQIRYLEDFVDVFRFEGPQLEKTGVYQARGGLVHWTEQLRERR